jgi:hypothetical protein
VIFPNRNTGATIGVILLVGGWLCLHDAYVRRGVKPPIPLRPFMWWR